MNEHDAIHVVADDPQLTAALSAAVRRGGGRICDLADASALVGAVGPQRISAILAENPRLDWVQLGGAGIEAYADVLDHERRWTSAKGAYAAPVAEHALALALGVLRQLPGRIRAREWGSQAGTSLHGLRVLVVGGGGIAQEIVRLLAVFDVHIVVVRRSEGSVPGAHETRGFEALDDSLTEADVVFLAAALTDETRGMFDARRFSLLPDGAVLVNIARGGLVETNALIDALDNGGLGGAGLDVTEPEPLPAGHPLFSHQKVIVTPHTADTPEMIRVMLAARVEDNTRRRLAGEQYVGLVNVSLGY